MKFDESIAPRQGHKGQPKPGKKHVSVGLSLEKFATAKVSKYNKRDVLQKRHEERVIQHGKFKKLQKRLEARGILEPVHAVDNVALLDGDLEGSAAPVEGHNSGRDKRNPVAQEKRQQHQHQQQSKVQNGGERKGTPGEPSSRLAHDDNDDDRQAGPSASRADKSEQQESHRHGGAEAGEGGRHQKKPKPPSQLQRIAEKIEKEKAVERKSKEEITRSKAERMAKIQHVEKARKREKAQYFKRTSRGQPLMKFRMDKLLHQIEKGS